MVKYKIPLMDTKPVTRLCFEVRTLRTRAKFSTSFIKGPN